MDRGGPCSGPSWPSIPAVTSLLLLLKSRYVVTAHTHWRAPGVGLFFSVDCAVDRTTIVLVVKILILIFSRNCEVGSTSTSGVVNHLVTVLQFHNS